jgi:hypothetical protein
MTTSNERLIALLELVVDEEPAGADHHPLHTEACPLISVLVAMAQHGFTSERAQHLADCGYCSLVIQTTWEELDQAGDEWDAAEEAATAMRSGGNVRRVRALAARGAHALITARDHLEQVPAGLRARVAAVASDLAQITEHDPATAGDLLSIALEAGGGPSVLAPGKGRSLAADVRPFVRQWADKAARARNPQALATAHELYVSLGDRSRAGACSLRRSALLSARDRVHDALVAAVTAHLELQEENTAGDAEAQLGRVFVAMGEQERADRHFDAALSIYGGAGKDEAVKRLLVERARPRGTEHSDAEERSKQLNVDQRSAAEKP